MLIFFLLKVVRGDFRYWMNLPNGLSLVVSFFSRFLAKVVTDFTLVMQMRHSYEIGGVQFLFLMMLNQVSCFVAGWVYLGWYDGGGVDSRKINGGGLWTGLLVLLCLFVLSCLCFVGLINRKCLRSFFSLTTGPQYSTVKFKAAMSDEQRIERFSTHPVYYEEVKGELQELIDEKWEEWMVDRPEWLTENVIANIPDEFLKNAEEEAKRVKEEVGRIRRRSSSGSIGVRVIGWGGAKIMPEETDGRA